jgi:hypothetical protein
LDALPAVVNFGHLVGRNRVVAGPDYSGLGYPLSRASAEVRHQTKMRGTAEMFTSVA